MKVKRNKMPRARNKMPGTGPSCRVERTSVIQVTDEKRLVAAMACPMSRVPWGLLCKVSVLPSLLYHWRPPSVTSPDELGVGCWLQSDDFFHLVFKSQDSWRRHLLLAPPTPPSLLSWIWASESPLLMDFLLAFLASQDKQKIPDLRSLLIVSQKTE